MSQQEILLKAIRKNLSPVTSIIDEVAAVLNISYDAAHRRIALKSKFSIEETVLLCRHYSISMDALFSGANKVLVEKTKEILTFDDLTEYFRQSTKYLKNYRTVPDAFLFYAAKDIPLFYTIGGTLLSKFKIYVWLNLLIGNEKQEAFEKFQLPQTLQEYTEELQTVYTNSEVSEIWNDTTINSSLQQIFYFFESGLVSRANAILLYDDVKKILANVEEKCSKAASRYNLYYNELLILNNNVVVGSAANCTMFIPYTALGYFITEDASTCKNASDYFKRQMQNSKSLNLSGTRDRKVFFNRALRKIDFYVDQVNSTSDLL